MIFNANQLNSLQEIFVTVLILYPTLIYLAFRAYLLEPPPQDYITKGKTMKKTQNSNEVKNGCTRSRIRIGLRRAQKKPGRPRILLVCQTPLMANNEESIRESNQDS